MTRLDAMPPKAMQLRSSSYFTRHPANRNSEGFGSNQSTRTEQCTDASQSPADRQLDENMDRDGGQDGRDGRRGNEHP